MNNIESQSKKQLIEIIDIANCEYLSLLDESRNKDKRIAELENFLTVARIPDSQEWLRKELNGDSND